MNRREFIKKIGGLFGIILLIPFLLFTNKEDNIIQSVFNRFPDPLNENEQQAIMTFLKKEIRNGNWSKMEAMYQYFPNSRLNSNTNWVN